ncbi:MAG: signal peptidase II, partial [Clostridia bacterium]|nr:signal peptidase II [Clostridia bacterium]
NRVMQIGKLKIKVHFGKVSAILIAVFAVLLTADLALKYCEEAYNWNFTVIPKFIWVESGCRNSGAAFSFLADTEWGRIFFIVLTFIMLAVMVGAFLLLPERFIWLKCALVMIAAGALGNLVDRLIFKEVRDFVWMNIFGSYACCNFADFWIVLGVVLAVVDMLFFNDWAVFPLTKRAKAAAKAREEAEKSKQKSIETVSAEKSDDNSDVNNTDNSNGGESGEE